MKILVLGCLTRATGNAVTARRLARHLATRHRVTLRDTRGLDTPRALADAARDVDLAVGVHALLAGPWLRRAGVPYALVLGGTDLYEPAHDLHARQMSLAVRHADVLVAFSDENARRAAERWPDARAAARVIAQSVNVACDPRYSLRRALGLAPDDRLLLLAAGLRRVKDPSHLLDAVGAWHARDRRVHLALVGDALEPDHADAVLRHVARTPGAHHVATLPRARFLAATREADVAVNSSVDEGMCGALLEAMRLGTPVVARRNAGNAALVTDRRNGVLYDTPDAFVTAARALLDDAALRHRLVAQARRDVATSHAPSTERDAWLDLVDALSRRHSSRRAC